jgi:hypothetical protein
LEVIAAAGIADFALDRRSHGRLRLRLVDRRRCVDWVGVDWVGIDRVGRVRIAIVRVRERGADEDPPDKGGAEAAAEAMETGAMEAVVMEASPEPTTRPTVEATAGRDRAGQS